ncbi:RHS repeat-associated core domain-containing protein [Pinirhizobacter soli]|uniref:RHS repeat-associated core domain-containing protein n=1 Tax=Pinirhizobacter soli TaxID=2786953 RepID=UPI00202A95BA|nr:RHS repeat-associated core domain-containing protein [Pinirhizobacter soli]
MRGNPVNSSTGNKYQEEVDGKWGNWLQLTRHYNSDSGTRSDHLGAGWRHTYSRSIEGDVYGANALRQDGKQITFQADPNTHVFSSDTNPYDQLTAAHDSNNNVTGWTLYWSGTRETEVYDASGSLISIQDSSGFVTSLKYSDASTSASIAPGPGFLITVRDPLGRVLNFSYNADGTLSSALGPDGNTYTYSYNVTPSLTNLSSISLNDGSSRTYGYSPGTNLLTSIIDENSATFATFSYNANGQALTSTHAGGALSFGFTYNSDGSTDVATPLGSTQHVTYVNPLGVIRVASVSSPCSTCGSNAASSIYDANGNPQQRTDFNGNVTLTTYDGNGLLTQKIESQGKSEQRTTDTTWNSALRQPVLRTVKNASGVIVSSLAWVYNSRGQVTASCEVDPAVASSYTCAPTGTPPAGVRRTINTYCDTTSSSCPVIGLLLSSDGPRTDVSDITTYTYYTSSIATNCGPPGSACHQAGDLYTVQDALGHTTTYASYDGAGRVTRITDVNGTNTDISYDPRGRVLTRSYGGATTTYGYDPVGNLTQVTDPDNVVTHYTYDDAHRLTDVTDALGNHIHYTLDNAGSKTAETVYDASNTVKRSIGRTFNALGQLTALRDGLNNTVLNAGFTDSYDANGNLVHTADALGVQRQSSFDSLNRLITTLDNYNGTDPATQNTTTRYGYDAKDNLVQVTDPSNLVTTYTLDGLANQTALSSPDTGTATATFDAAGNQLTRTDARGIVATSTYDALNRILSTTYADTSLNVTYHYDEANSVTGCSASQPMGQLTRMVEVAVTTTYCYDSRGNVIRKMQTQGAATDTTAMAYTSANRLQSLTYPSGTVVSYTRNANGQIAAAALTPAGGTAASAVSNMAYLPFGPVQSYTLGNGQTVTRTYDANYAFTDVVSPALAIHVARDALGNVVALGNAPGASPATETYSYDPLYRLTGIVDGTNTVQAYTYNATGDRLSKTGSGLATGDYSYDAGTHHLNAVGNGARTSDANGNTTASVFGGQTFGFGYNGRNRMTVAQSNGQMAGTYVQNAMGQRTSKSTSFPTVANERFTYDTKNQLIAEHGTSSRDYLWVNDLPVAVIDYTSSTNALSFIHADALNTPRSVTTSSGSAIWQWPYLGNSFGELAPTGSYTFNLRFPGQYYDAESSMAYNVHRDYEASTGRYLQSDPIGLGGGLTTYGYVASSPLHETDALGLQGSPQLCVENPAWAEACEAAGMLPKPRPVPVPSPAQVGGAIGAAAVGGLSGDAAPATAANPAIPDCQGGDLCEQLALAEAKAGAGRPIMNDNPLGDLPRLLAHYGPGDWVKMQHSHRCADGRLVVIHYFSNGAGLNVELKIVSGGIGG